MTTRSDPKIRLFIFVARVAVVTALLVQPVDLGDREVPIKRPLMSVAKEIVKSKKGVGKSHPLVKPTQFYATTLIEDPPPLREVSYSDAQIKRESIMLMLLHHDGDLLGDQSFEGARDLVTNDQLFEAKMIARDYDTRLKEIRRERAQILENAGVTIDDPSEAMEKIHIKAFYLCSGVHTRILKEVLTADQRRAIAAKFKSRRLAAQAKAEKLKAEQDADGTTTRISDRRVNLSKPEIK